MIVLVILGFAGFGYLQISSLARKKWWRELSVFIFLWLSGFILSSLLTLGIEIPPVTTLLGNLVTGILT
jgi:hypothetical protein